MQLRDWPLGPCLLRHLIGVEKSEIVVGIAHPVRRRRRSRPKGGITRLGCLDMLRIALNLYNTSLARQNAQPRSERGRGQQHTEDHEHEQRAEGRRKRTARARKRSLQLIEAAAAELCNEWRPWKIQLRE